MHFDTPHGVVFEQTKSEALGKYQSDRSRIEVGFVAPNGKTRRALRSDCNSIVEQATEFSIIAEGAVEALKRLDNARVAATAYYREFKTDHGIRRDARKPDIFKTLMVAQCALLGEGGLTAVLMIADGKMDVLPGLAYGVSISAINIATGFVAGLFPFRFLSYRSDAPNPQPRDKKVRWVARFSATLAVSAMGVLHLAAARVRATGSHHDIFDFSQVGFGATFNDFYGLAIITLGTIGSILAIYKGRTGLSDPIPGFLEVREDAETKIDDAALDLFETNEDLLDDRLDDLLDPLEDMLDTMEEEDVQPPSLAQGIEAKISEHNTAIDSTKAHLIGLADQEHVRREYIAGQCLPKKAPDLAVFEALKLTIPNGAQIARAAAPDPYAQVETAIAQVKAAHGQAMAKLREAYGAFRANTPDFQFNTDTGDKDHE